MSVKNCVTNGSDVVQISTSGFDSQSYSLPEDSKIWKGLLAIIQHS